MRHIFDLCLLVVFRSFLWRNFHVTELEALTFYGRNQSRYSSNEFISECLSIFSEVLQEMQDSELDVANSCLPISVMWDESESVGQVEELITYVSWIDRNTLQKKTAFLNICDVKSQTAEEIEKNIVRTLIQKKLIARVIGGGLDGCSTNTGTKSGVVTRLRSYIPWLFAVHCIAHRLNLAVRTASRQADIPCLADFESVLIQLFYFYHNSPCRHGRMRELQNVLNLPSMHSGSLSLAQVCLIDLLFFHFLILLSCLLV